MNNNTNINSNDSNAASPPIPVGFRFHPTDEELVGYYLHGKVGRAQRDELIQELDLYKIEPWDLHELCRIGDDAAENQSDWYFFSHKDKKYPTGNRANRATAAGFWKATGRDKAIHTQHRHVIGMRKTLVFYLGRAPHGQKTDWIMHEFRLDSENNNNGPGQHASPGNYESEGWVVCRVFRKTKNFKTKSQEDTSCSFETDTEPPNNSNNCNNQLVSEVSPNFGMSNKGGSGNHVSHGNNSHGLRDPDYSNHGHFNFTCKQELTVDDYPAFTITDSHLHHTVTGLHRSTRQQQHNNMNTHSEFQGFSTVKDFDDARSSTTAFMPGHCSHHNTTGLNNNNNINNNNTSHQDWMLDGGRDNVLRLHSGGASRRDQTLADVTCHLHVKRQQTAAFMSHENLVHLWN